MNDVNSGELAQRKSWIARLSEKLSGKPNDTEALIGLLREAQQRHILSPDALSMIEGVFQFSEMRVRDIMIPRTQMVVVPQDAELETIFPLVIETAHSRFPVIGEDRSQVDGILLAKDLLAHIKNGNNLLVRDVLRKAQFVPESKRLNVMLKEFRTNRNHMAIVVDEYGTVAGLVTIEDVLEQIVGEIEDEHDFADEEFVSCRSEGEFAVKALMPIDEFNDYFTSNLSDDEFDTIGGLIVNALGHVPKRSECVNLQNFKFEILRSDNRRVHLLKVIVENSNLADTNDQTGEE